MFTINPSTYPLIDIGVNLTHESFEADFKQVVDRARQANVQHFVVTGSDMDESRKAHKLAADNPELFSATAGIHPHYADQYNDQSSETLEKLAQDTAISAIGETGLDFFRDISPRDQQIKSFTAHIALAKKYTKPMFLHQRDAHAVFHSVLKEHRDELSHVVVHCFTDTAEALDDYLDLDCHIGITGWICDERRGGHLLDCVSSIPSNRLMLETDSPYLMPRTLRPKPKTRRNEPCTLPEILHTVAKARGESPEDLAKVTTDNARKFFSIDSLNQ